MPSVKRYVDNIVVRRPSFYPDTGGEGWYPELQYPTQARLGVRYSYHLEKQVYVQLNAIFLSCMAGDMTQQEVTEIFKGFGPDLHFTLFKQHLNKPHLQIGILEFPTPRQAEEAILFANDNWKAFRCSSFCARYSEVNAAGLSEGSTRDILLVREDFALTPPFTPKIFGSVPMSLNGKSKVPIPDTALPNPPTSVKLPAVLKSPTPAAPPASPPPIAAAPAWNAVDYSRDSFHSKRKSYDRHCDRDRKDKKGRYTSPRRMISAAGSPKHEDRKHNHQSSPSKNRDKRLRDVIHAKHRSDKDRHRSHPRSPSFDAHRSNKTSRLTHDVESDKQQPTHLDKPKAMPKVEVPSEEDLLELLNACAPNRSFPIATSFEQVPQGGDSRVQDKSDTFDYGQGGISLADRIGSFCDDKKETVDGPIHLKARQPQSSSAHCKRRRSKYADKGVATSPHAPPAELPESIVDLTVNTLPTSDEVQRLMHPSSLLDTIEPPCVYGWIGLSSDGSQLVIAATRDSVAISNGNNESHAEQFTTSSSTKATEHLDHVPLGPEEGEIMDAAPFPTGCDSQSLPEPIIPEVKECRIWRIDELPKALRETLHMDRLWTFVDHTLAEYWPDPEGKMIVKAVQEQGLEGKDSEEEVDVVLA